MDYKNMSIEELEEALTPKYEPKPDLDHYSGYADLGPVDYHNLQKQRELERRKAIKAKYENR